MFVSGIVLRTYVGFTCREFCVKMPRVIIWVLANRIANRPCRRDVAVYLQCKYTPRSKHPYCKAYAIAIFRLSFRVKNTIPP